MSIDQNIDRYGRAKDDVLAEYKAKMINPRLIAHAETGKISNGEMHIYNKLLRLRDGEIPYENDSNLDGHLVPMDSLLESAFNTNRNDDWKSYKISLMQPQVTE